MKKYILAVLATSMLLTGCGANTNIMSLYDKGLEMAQVIDKMAEDDADFTLFSENENLKEIVQKLLAKIIPHPNKCMQ